MRVRCSVLSRFAILTIMLERSGKVKPGRAHCCAKTCEIPPDWTQ